MKGLFAVVYFMALGYFIRYAKLDKAAAAAAHRAFRALVTEAAQISRETVTAPAVGWIYAPGSPRPFTWEAAAQSAPAASSLQLRRELASLRQEFLGHV